MQTSERLAILYRVWANEIWKVITDYLTGTYSWSLFDNGCLCYVQAKEDKPTRSVGIEFGQHTQVGLIFETKERGEIKLFVPMQYVLENLQILKDFLLSGEVSIDSIKKSAKKFDETNPDFFEKELMHDITISA